MILRQQGPNVTIETTIDLPEDGVIISSGDKLFMLTFIIPYDIKEMAKYRKITYCEIYKIPENEICLVTIRDVLNPPENWSNKLNLQTFYLKYIHQDGKTLEMIKALNYRNGFINVIRVSEFDLVSRSYHPMICFDKISPTMLFLSSCVIKIHHIESSEFDQFHDKIMKILNNEQLLLNNEVFYN